MRISSPLLTLFRVVSLRPMVLTVIFAPAKRSSHLDTQDRYFPMKYSLFTSRSAVLHSEPDLGASPAALRFWFVAAGVILALRLVEKILSRSIVDCGSTVISGPAAMLSTFNSTEPSISNQSLTSVKV